MKSFLAAHGISHYTTPPHTPEHNGLSERKHRHIVETGLTLLSTATMPKTYWPYAFSTAVYLINRLPKPVLSQTSPYQKLFLSSPNYSKLRVFRCACFPWLRPYALNKLADRSKRCVFLGYSLTQTAYHYLDRESGRVYSSRHIQFLENEFPFSASLSTTVSTANSNVTTQVHHLPLIQSSPPPSLSLHPSASSSGHPPLSPLVPASSSHARTQTQISSNSSTLSSEPTAPSENGLTPTVTPPNRF